MSDFKIKVLADGLHFDYDLSFELVDSFSQKVLLILNTWKTEFAYDESAGVEYQSVMEGRVKSSALESFFMLSLKEQLPEFKTLDTFTLDFNRKKSEAKVSFIAYSIDGLIAKIDSFKL